MLGGMLKARLAMCLRRVVLPLLGMRKQDQAALRNPSLPSSLVPSAPRPLLFSPVGPH